MQHSEDTIIEVKLRGLRGEKSAEIATALGVAGTSVRRFLGQGKGDPRRSEARVQADKEKDDRLQAEAARRFAAERGNPAPSNSTATRAANASAGSSTATATVKTRVMAPPAASGSTKKTRAAKEEASDKKVDSVGGKAARQKTVASGTGSAAPYKKPVVLIESRKKAGKRPQQPEPAQAGPSPKPRRVILPPGASLPTASTSTQPVGGDDILSKIQASLADYDAVARVTTALGRDPKELSPPLTLGSLPSSPQTASVVTSAPIGSPRFTGTIDPRPFDNPPKSLADGPSTPLEAPIPPTAPSEPALNPPTTTPPALAPLPVPFSPPQTQAPLVAEHVPSAQHEVVALVEKDETIIEKDEAIVEKDTVSEEEVEKVEDVIEQEIAEEEKMGAVPEEATEVLQHLNAVEVEVEKVEEVAPPAIEESSMSEGKLEKEKEAEMEDEPAYEVVVAPFEPIEELSAEPISVTTTTEASTELILDPLEPILPVEVETGAMEIDELETEASPPRLLSEAASSPVLLDDILPPADFPSPLFDAQPPTSSSVDVDVDVDVAVEVELESQPIAIEESPMAAVTPIPSSTFITHSDPSIAKSASSSIIPPTPIAPLEISSTSAIPTELSSISPLEPSSSVSTIEPSSTISALGPPPTFSSDIVPLGEMEVDDSNASLENPPVSGVPPVENGALSDAPFIQKVMEIDGANSEKPAETAVALEVQSMGDVVVSEA